MQHVLTCTCLLMTWSIAFGAETKPGEPIKLDLHPAASPSPALKYRLLPDLSEQQTGNAVQLYYRGFSPEWMNWYYRDNNGEKIYNLRNMPYAEFLRTPEAKEGWLRNSKQLQEVDLAARRSYCDWELTDRVKAEGMSLLLPDVQSMRAFGNMVGLRTRVSLAHRDFDGSLRSLQTGLAMGRHIGDAPLLLTALVGIAVSHDMLQQVEEFIQQPGAPNLYWALSDLPHPFIDLHKAFLGERLFFDTIFPEVKDLDKPALTAQQVPALVDQHAKALQGVTIYAGDGAVTEFKLGLIAMAIKDYPEAKRWLIAQGRQPEQVEALPAFQVVMMHARHQYYEFFDDLTKWQGLPYWQARVGLNEAEGRLKASKARLDGMPFAHMMLPAFFKVIDAQMRLDRRIAALRCIEAIRLHAAANQGRLPAKLSDIKEVPLPVDPVTGKDFEYELAGDKATLRGPLAWKGAPMNFAINYELTMAR